MRLKPILVMAGFCILTGVIIWWSSMSKDHESVHAGRTEVLTVSVAAAGVHEKPDSSSPLVTQALYGWPVQIKNRLGNWLYVLCYDGSQGWLKDGLLEKHPWGRQLVVHTLAAPLFTAPSPDAPSSGELFMGSLVTAGNYQSGFYEINLQKGTRWVQASLLTAVQGPGHVNEGAGEEPVARAMLFKDTPYLWGGMTQKGIDCSGLCFIAYLSCGIKIPRDADVQFLAGSPVPRNRLKPGDLVFFALGGGEAPSHVGLYIGGEEFINARSKGGVIINSLSDPYFLASYLGARRYVF